MFELLKEKNTGIFLGCLIILIMFIQLIGLLFEPDKFEWRDEFFLSFVLQLCNYCRVIKAINEAGSTFFYWGLMFFGFFYLIAMIGLLVYMNYFLKNRKHYVEHVVKLLRIMILLMYWIFYMPFFESFISILNCHNGVHYLDSSITCFQGIHIFYFVLCIIFLILLFLINIIIAMLYNETQPVQEDCLSRLESSFEVALVIYRSIVATFSNFCGSEVCAWVLIAVFIISSAMLCYQYYKQIPYYNAFVSVFCGSLIFIYFWISINALLMKLLEVSGHIIIIIVGIPLIVFLVKNLREKRIENLMKTNIDKLKLDIDALIQVHNMTDFAKGVHKDQTHRMTMIGIVNLHILECQNADCPCKDEYELYDVATSHFAERNVQAPHQDEVFLNHLIKRLYEDALNKFINSPSIHIAFAFYLFKVMKNIHASLVELNIAIKKKPSLQQQFTIFRYKNIIEDYIIQDHQEHKYVYPELTNVIEFERLFGEMQKAIEKVCNLQVEFWTHLTTVVPDLNILNDLGKKIYTASQEADSFWNQLCKINPNYQAALNIYGEYLKEIRNHEHLGNTFIERAFNSINAKKSVDEHGKASDILFNEDTTVIHISGNKESIGKILKTSSGLSKVFGYSKTEVIGHSINILMPTLFAKKHTDFLERFFRTGRQVIFYQERTLFATHRNGHCFQMKILVKQMPSLAEGIQYVGMIKPSASEYEYMLTDMDGVIDSFSKGITSIIGLTPNLFKDKDSQINIQIIAPELIPFFLETQQKGRAAKSKFRDAGGDMLTLIVPRDFHIIAKSEAKSNPRQGGRSRGARGQSNNTRNRSTVFKQFLKCLAKPKKIARDKMPTTKLLMQQQEYQQYERKKEVNCEITCLDIKASTNDTLKMLVFKFNKNDKGDKKKVDDIAQLMGQYNNEREPHENGLEQFKQESLGDEDKHDDGPPMLGLGALNNQLSGPPLEPQISKKKTESTKKVIFQQDIKLDKLDNMVPITTQSSGKNPQPGEQSVRGPLQSSRQSRGDQQQQQQQNSLTVQQQSSQPPQSNAFTVKDLKSGKVDSMKQDKESDGRQSKKIFGSLQDNNNDLSGMNQEEEKKEPDFMDYSEIETPKLDVSGLKLESAQKEKVSFFEELKKQSFILSENSTQKMEAKDSLNIGEQQKQEKKSFELQQKNGGAQLQQQRSKQSQSSSIQQEPDKMVRKQNLNNMNRNFGGDDEPQEIIKESEEVKSEDSQDEENSQDQSKSKKDSDDGEDDEDEEESGEENSVSKSKSRSSKKKGNEPSNYDSQENDDDYEKDDEEANDGKTSGKRSGPSGGGSQGSKKMEMTDKQPLLSGQYKTPLPDLAPNMNDFKRGFDDDKDDGALSSRNPRAQSKKDMMKGFDGQGMNSKNNENAGPQFKKMQIQKRDTFKIKTNPKYKCVDEGSEDENADQKNNLNDNDPQQLSSKEMDFRETILKYEKRRKRKERKQKEKEQKKIKALNGEESPQVPTAGGDATATKTPGASSDDDEIESSSSSSSSEETKDGNNNNNKLTSKKKAPKSNNDEGEVSSVTTRQNKTERNHYILRMAIDEKYIPSSIQNLRFAAYIIFFILVVLAIVYYVIQISLFDKINQNIKNIHNSELRLNYIIDITLRTRTLILMNGNYLNLTDKEKSALLNTTIAELRSSATNLKNAQTDLSLKTAKLSSDQLQKINPDDIIMQYHQYPNMPDKYIFSIWEAIMEIVVSAYRISTLALSDITDSHPTTFFVLKNCLNSVLEALNSSTDAIIEESDASRLLNMQVFLYLLIAASCALFISLVFLIPVINKVKKNKQEVLELFTHKNIEKHIDDQLKVCRNFVSMRLQQNNEAADHDIDGEDGNMNVNDKELQNELNNNKYMKRIKKKSKGKKWKKLNTDFGSTLLKFLLFICIIEGYFLACYLLSYKFLQEVQDLTQELKLLISRQPVQSFLLLIQKELIYSNGTALIEGQPSLTYVPDYHEQLYDQEELLLDRFSQNYDYHSGSYNDDFNNIIYADVCQFVDYDSKTECEAFNQGILKKGIYSSVIKYWDFLRQLNHDFLESNRSQAVIKQFLNEPRLQIAEKMQDYYFKMALTKLVGRLENDIDNFFNMQYIQSRTLFIIYIIYIVILYFLIWRKFVSIMQNELWKTKSMLSILPTKLCFEIEEIRYFIYANSSNDFLSSKL